MGLWCYLLTTPLKNSGGLLTVLYRGYPYLWMSVSTEDCEKFEELVIHGIAPPPASPKPNHLCVSAHEQLWILRSRPIPARWTQIQPFRHHFLGCKCTVLFGGRLLSRTMRLDFYFHQLKKKRKKSFLPWRNLAVLIFFPACKTKSQKLSRRNLTFFFFLFLFLMYVNQCDQFPNYLVMSFYRSL